MVVSGFSPVLSGSLSALRAVQTKAAPTGAAPAQAPAADSAPQTLLSLADEWEANGRSLREEFMTRRLDTAKEIMRALSPLVVGALSWNNGSLARPLASALEGISRELQSVVEELGREARGRGPVTEANAESFAGLRGVADLAADALRQASTLVTMVGAVSDESPLPGRDSTLRVAQGAADHLLKAWNDLGAVYAGLGSPRLNVTA